MNTTEAIHYTIKVTGRVQGVGFRHFAQTKARYYGIHGYVKNLPDGSVLIEAEGSRNQLDEFVSWCRKGPGFGFVESITIDTTPYENLSKFRILY